VPDGRARERVLHRPVLEVTKTEEQVSALPRRDGTGTIPSGMSHESRRLDIRRHERGGVLGALERVREHERDGLVLMADVVVLQPLCNVTRDRIQSVGEPCQREISCQNVSGVEGEIRAEVLKAVDA
jgi:hypothetical protein